MLDKKYINKVCKQILAYNGKRRQVIKLTSDAQHLAKIAIFAMQRDDFKEADVSLKKAKMILSSIKKKYSKEKDIFSEGSYKASLEEYVEAVIFRQCLQGKKIGGIVGIDINPNIYISGLCDVPGELLRYAIKSATERNFKQVEKCLNIGQEIIGEMVKMNLTGYNRQKFDQAKNALNKLQTVVYEVSLQK